MIAAGADEAGRGPIAGPVVAAAAVLTGPQMRVLLAEGMNDSKRLSEARRERIFARMDELGVQWAAHAATAREIDETDILRASLSCMRRALETLEARGVRSGLVIVDGSMKIPGIAPDRQRALPKADGIVPAVMAASIAAKVIRDRIMRTYDGIYPGYGFAKHKGYPTAAHRAAVDMLGPSPIHRMSFGGYNKMKKNGQLELGGDEIWR